MFRSISSLMLVLWIALGVSGCGGGGSSLVADFESTDQAWSARLSEAQSHLSSGDLTAALSLAEQLIRERPIRLAGYLLASDAAVQMGETVIGAAHLEQARERFPRDPAVIRRLAFLYARQPESRDQALALYRLLIALSPEDPDAESLRALVQGESVDGEIPEGTPAVDVTPGDTLTGALASGNLKAASTHLERVLASGQVTAEELIRVGHLFVDAGDVESGLRAFTAAQEKGYDTPELAESLGDAWSALEDWDRAVANYRRGIQRNPDHARIKRKLEQTYARIVRAKREGK